MVGYNKDDRMTNDQKLIAGCLSGVLTRFITQPLDVIKLRTQLQKTLPDPSRKWFRTTRKIFKEEGVTAFWHGHNLGQVHSVLAVSSQFFVYEMATKYVANAEIDARYKHVLVFLSGIFAGCCSATLVFPLEVIRVRQMLVQEQYRGILRGARKVYIGGGFLAFYEGLSASLLQMGPQVGLSFYVFNFVQLLILSHFAPPKCLEGNCTLRNVHRPEHLLVASTIAGCASGFVAKSLTYPFDLAKRRMQIGSHKSDDKYKAPSTAKHVIRCKALTDCLIKTYNHEGFWGLYRGWKVTIYKAQITSVVAFTTYELICYAIREISTP